MRVQMIEEFERRKLVFCRGGHLFRAAIIRSAVALSR
jgi:hypothetical protein